MKLLARPRRFGKSLFLSAMRYFFQGERDLFKGLYADSMDWDWKPRLVLYLDLNTGDNTDTFGLESTFESNLRRWEEKFGLEKKDDSYANRFETILKSLHEKTGKQCIILVDEYDKPLVKNLNKDDFEAFREKLAALYSNFKTCADDIRLVFMTGVSRFSKLSVFSGLNNIRHHL